MLLAKRGEVLIQRTECDEADRTGLLALVVIIVVDESFCGAVCDGGADADAVFSAVSHNSGVFVFTAIYGTKKEKLRKKLKPV